MPPVLVPMILVIGPPGAGKYVDVTYHFMAAY
jgi:hypothetical protein